MIKITGARTNIISPDGVFDAGAGARRISLPAMDDIIISVGRRNVAIKSARSLTWKRKVIEQGPVSDLTELADIAFPRNTRMVGECSAPAPVM